MHAQHGARDRSEEALGETFEELARRLREPSSMESLAACTDQIVDELASLIPDIEEEELPILDLVRRWIPDTAEHIETTLRMRTVPHDAAYDRVLANCERLRALQPQVAVLFDNARRRALLRTHRVASWESLEQGRAVTSLGGNAVSDTAALYDRG